MSGGGGGGEKSWELPRRLETEKFMWISIYTYIYMGR